MANRLDGSIRVQETDQTEQVWRVRWIDFPRGSLTVTPEEGYVSVQFTSAALADLQVYAGAGLNASYNGGFLKLGGNVASEGTTVAAGSLSLPDNSTSYVYVTPNGRVLSSTSNPGPPNILLALVTTASGAITTVADKRAWLHFPNYQDFIPVYSATGLDIFVWGGKLRQDTTITDVANASLTLTDASTNYIEVSKAGTISSNTTGFTSGAFPIATMVTASGNITTYTDKRTLLAFPFANTAQSSPSNPTGTTDTTGKMMGLAGAITPRATGKIMIVISGNITNNTAADGAGVQIRYGTGTAPSNADALTGTTAGGLVTHTNIAAETLTVPFSLNAIVTGLTIGTAYWIDVGLKAITGGTASITNLSVSVVEL